MTKPSPPRVSRHVSERGLDISDRIHRSGWAIVRSLRAHVLWLGGLLLGGFIGLACAMISPILVIVAVISLATAAIVIARPEIGALSVVCLALVVPHDLLFRHGLSLGSGSLKVTDALIGLSLAGWIAHRAVDRDARRMPWWPVSWAVSAILVIALFAVSTNAGNGGSTQLALTDLRPLLALSLVFPLVAFLDRGVSSRGGASFGSRRMRSRSCVDHRPLCHRVRGLPATFSSGAIRVTDVAFVAPLIGVIWALVLLPSLRAAGSASISVATRGILLGRAVLHAAARGLADARSDRCLRVAPDDSPAAANAPWLAVGFGRLLRRGDCCHQRRFVRPGGESALPAA